MSTAARTVCGTVPNGRNPRVLGTFSRNTAPSVLVGIVGGCFVLQQQGLRYDRDSWSVSREY